MRTLILLALVFAAPLCAVTWTVTNLNDTGAGSLRDTVAAAAAGDEIVFDASLAGGTITLGSMIQPTVALTITGLTDASGKPGITLDGNNAVALLEVVQNLTLINLRLTKGLGQFPITVGAAEFVASNCVFQSNAFGSNGATVFVNDGFAHLTNCMFLDNAPTATAMFTVAGCLYLRNAHLVARHCTFARNTSDSSGVIMAYVSSLGKSFEITVEDSTFSGNTARDTTMSGGAAYLQTATGFPSSAQEVRRALVATFCRCTFTDNTSQAGSPAHCMCLINTSYGFTKATLQDCIVHGTASGAMFRVSDTGSLQVSGFYSLGYNLCSDAPAWMNRHGDQVNTDPLLLPLADNGGLTLTHAIAANSPARNAGRRVSGMSTDQRGLRRGLIADIGAFELQGSDIGVAEGAQAVANGGILLGLTVVQPGTAQLRTITISNAVTAEQDLAITLPVTISSEVNCTAIIMTQPGATLAPGASSDLVVEATPVAGGFFQYTVTILSDDPDTSTFTFVVAGYAQAPAVAGGGGGEKKSRDDDKTCSVNARASWHGLALPGLFALLVLRRRRTAYA
ncbi:MAG: hypothetical protein HS108_10985 [Planctomycetes bacterium]|nr:hypothetical protein [Planctomycetota bacterium]MCL4730760.1 hypothetical protein [Planctomycetota bacterium]